MVASTSVDHQHFLRANVRSTDARQLGVVAQKAVRRHDHCNGSYSGIVRDQMGKNKKNGMEVSLHGALWGLYGVV